MALNKTDAQIYEDHLSKQEKLAQTIQARFNNDAIQFAADNNPNIARYKAMLAAKLKQLKDGEKIALTLVDIQNDFVLDGFALGAPGYENTIKTNCELLEAVKQLVIEGGVAEKIQIVTSQDAHVYQRPANHTDLQVMAASSYGSEHTQKVHQTELTELKPLAPAKGQFAPHCIVGTIGAAIAQPVEDYLEELHEKGVAVNRFGKMNFSGPEAGLKLKDNLRLDDPTLLNTTESIYVIPAVTYADFFQEQQYKHIFITGICGDVCVQQAALGLAAVFQNQKDLITVLDPAVTYLGNPSYDEARSKYVREYQAHNINYYEDLSQRSNPNTYSLFSQIPIEKQIRIEDLTRKYAIVKYMHELVAKRDEMKNRGGCENAVYTLDALLHDFNLQLSTLTPQLGTTGESAALGVFKTNCLTAIADHRNELENHRGKFKPVLEVLDILAKIVSALVSFVTLGGLPWATGRNPYRLFPYFETATAQKLDNFEVALKSIPNPA